MKIAKIHTILYVKNQEKSTAFYEKIFRRKADLFVSGMTEFCLSQDFTLGLMPNEGIANILKDKTPHPETGTGIPRCEMYFYVENLVDEYEILQNIGIEMVSTLSERNWGDEAFYFADLDGHIIAFAKKINTKNE